MIGVFDSGLGGLQSLKYFKKLYPEYDYIFLGDNKNMPYGEKSAAEIRKFTFAGLNWLFDNGVKIVILACNTAAAYSIRAWQATYPDKKVLSITIPGVEKIIHGQCGVAGILTTQATLEAGIYHDLFARLGGHRHHQIISIGASELVPAIEAGNLSLEDREKLIKKYLDKFPSELSCLVLGCTHFPIWMDSFKKLFKGNIIDSAYESAVRFGSYLEKHPEIENKLSTNGTVKFFVSGEVENFQKIGERIWGDSRFEVTNP